MQSDDTPLDAHRRRAEPPGESRSSRQRDQEWRTDPITWVCLLVFAAATLGSLVNLGTGPFWVDEAVAALPAISIHSHGVPSTTFDLNFMPWQLEYGLWDPATPLYRYALAAFTAAPGFSETTARGFSVLMGVLTCVPLFLLAREIFDRRVALLAATFLVTSPAFMVHAREARHFTFQQCLIVCTLYLLYRTAERPESRAQGLWVPFLIACLLTQTLGYAIFAVAGLYLLVNGWRRFFDRRHRPLYYAAVGVYLAVMLVFWHTLPFFHTVDCSNRVDGCRDDAFYYVGILAEFLAPSVSLQGRQMAPSGSVFGPTQILFVVGVAIVVAAARRRRLRTTGWSLILIWLFVPLVILTLWELKYSRYLFIWIMPVVALLVAVAVARVARVLGGAGRWDRPLTLALAALVVVAPQWDVRPDGPGLHSGLYRFVRDELIGAQDDNFERIRWQVSYLTERMGPDDVVVTSFDDASLSYYVDQDVYGFLNNHRTDEFFLGLLEEARRQDAKVWFLDTLPQWNFCLTDEPEPKSFDCREKFPEFYRTCVSGTYPTCERVPFG